MALKALLFDLDGVLCDSRAPITACINHALVRHGRAALPIDELVAYIGPPLYETFFDIMGEADLASACVRAYQEAYRERSLVETTICPGITDALALLAGRFRLGVATSKPALAAQPILDALALASWFECVAGPALDGDVEPKDVTFGRALEELGVRGEEAALVGDRLYDIVAAHAHGALGIGATWGVGSIAELDAAGADMLVHSPAELVAVLS